MWLACPCGLACWQPRVHSKAHFLPIICNTRCATALYFLSMAAAVRGNMLGQALCRPLRPAARGFCSAPWPNVTVADIQARVNTPRGRNPAGAAPLGHPLTEKARSQQAAARRTGYLQVTNQCGPSLLSQYFAYCVGTGRPYIAVSKFGDVVTVDVTPGVCCDTLQATAQSRLARTHSLLPHVPRYPLPWLQCLASARPARPRTQ